MADFTLFHLLITSSVWHSDEKTLRVWITLLGLCDNGIARVAVKSLALSARVSEDDCRAAIKTLSEPDLDSRGTENDGRRLERVDGGFRILNADTYLEILRAEKLRSPKPTRTAYMRDYMARRRDAEKGRTPSPQRPPPAPPRPSPSPQGFTPPSIEDALAFALLYNNGQGLTRGLSIAPEVVHAWFEDRKSLGWTVVKNQMQVPLSDWKSDLPKYAATWKRNQGSDLFARGHTNKAHRAGTPGDTNSHREYKSRALES